VFWTRLSRRLRREEGVALVEFALILPLFLALVFGIFDFGRAFNYWNDETHLAASGARWAVVNANLGGTPTTLQQFIRSQVETKELLNGSASVTKPVTVCVNFPNGTRNPGDPVTVRVFVKYKILSFFGAIPGSKLFNPTIQLVGKATMRLETTPDTTYIPTGSGGTGSGCP
jgi:Flp pilus assembly protein TadG